jgi:hypothetical protein
MAANPCPPISIWPLILHKALQLLQQARGITCSIARLPHLQDEAEHAQMLSLLCLY